MTTEETIPAWVSGQLRPVGKLEVHRRGLRHKAVSVFVTDRGRLLIQRRALGKYHTPGLWANSCCTHPRWGEPPLACAERRLAEELGIERLPLRPVGEIEYRADVGGGLTEHEEVSLFAAEAGPDLVVAPNPEEVMDWAWISAEELAASISAEPARYTPWLRIYMTERRGALFGAPV